MRLDIEIDTSFLFLLFKIPYPPRKHPNICKQLLHIHLFWFNDF